MHSNDVESSGSDSESDFEDDPPSSPSSVVQLGFARKLNTYDSYLFLPHFFPVGKLGGRPSWLSFDPLPDVEEELTCPSCAQPMPLLLQLYAPQSAEHTFHRTIYVFMCAKPKCCKANSADNLVVLRCQLPQVNRFHSSHRSCTAEEDGPTVEPEHRLEEFNTLCVVCGCLGDKKCGQCHSVHYCSRAHQAWHWKRGGHKANCGKGDGDDQEGLPQCLFKEFLLETRPEILRSRPQKARSEALRVADYDEYMKKHEGPMEDYKELGTKVEGSEGGREVQGDYEAKNDKVFDRFQRVLASNPRQVLRYSRNGRPLLATGRPDDAPNKCPNCGGKRTFEFQITPYTLSLLDLDSVEASIDFATILIYTCAADCGEGGKYVREMAVKQDFNE